MRIGKISQFFNPNYGYCRKCQTSWKWVTQHKTQYREWSACAPLCEACWKELRYPENRVYYYREMWENWRTDDSELWNQIEQAVFEGK